MQSVKRILAAVLLFITALFLAVTGAYFLVGDATLVALLTKQVAGASNTHITYRQDGAITRTLAPTLSINELLIEDVSKKFQVSISTLQLQLSLPGLLFGKLDIPLLDLGDTLVQIQADGNGGKFNMPDSLPLRPILHHVNISNISIDSAGSKYTLPPIHVQELSLSPDLGADKIISTLQIELGGRDILINLEIPGLDQVMKSRILPFSIAAKGPRADLSLNGKVDFNPPSPAVEAIMQVHVADLQQFSTGVKGFNFPGELTGTSQVKGSVDQLALEDISVHWQGPDQSTAALSGRIADIIEPAGFDLNLAGQLNKPAWLGPMLPDSMGAIKSAELSARIEGAWKQAGIRAFKLEMNTMDALDLSLNGQLDLAHTSKGMAPDNIDLKLVFAAPTTHAAKSLFFEQVWEFGAITGSADIRSSESGDPSLQNIVVQARTGDGIAVDLTGSIARFPLDPDRSSTGYDLHVNMKAAETKAMAAVFGTQLPLEGVFDITYRITGDTEALQLNDIDLSAGEKNGVHLDVKGKVLFGDWGQGDPLQGIDLTFRGSSIDTQSLGAVFKQQLPELGAVRAAARLHRVSGENRIDDLNIRLGVSDTPAATGSGSIKQLFAAADIDLAVKLNLDGNSFAPFADMPDMAALNGDIFISNSGGSLGVDKLHVKGGNEKVFSLDIKGDFADFKEAETLAVDVRLTARDLQLLGSLVNLEWPAIGPVTLDGQARNKGEGLVFDTTLTAGKTKLEVEISSFSHTAPPHIRGKITAQEFFLPELLGKKTPGTKDKPPEKEHVFSRTPIDWDWLKKNDLDFSVIIESFDKESSDIESARFEIVLKGGHLSVSPAELVYPKGKIEFDLKLDVQDQPQISLKAFGENINPWLALDMQNTKTKNDFDAELDIDMEFSSSGVSAHELASNLEGDFYVIIKNGRIKKDLLNMVFVDLIGWTLNKAVGVKYADVDCGVAEYTVRKGVIGTDAFYLDTPNIAIAGEGSIDLGRETIDYTFLPRKKTKLISSADPVNVKGSLSAPSVSVIPLKSAAAKYGSLFFAPYLFAGIFAAEFVTDTLNIKISKSPCMEYEKKHQQDQEKAGKESKPEGLAPRPD